MGVLIIHTSHISRSEMIHHINSSEIDLGRRPKESCSFAVSWIIVHQGSSSPLHPTHNLGERAVARHGSWCGEAAVQSFLTILAFGGSAAVARMQVCRTAPRCVALRRGPLGPFLRSVQWRSLHLTCRLPACRCPTSSQRISRVWFVSECAEIGRSCSPSRSAPDAESFNMDQLAPQPWRGYCRLRAMVVASRRGGQPFKVRGLTLTHP